MAGNKGKVADFVDDIGRIFQVVNGHSKRAEKDAGITGPQLWAIKAIAENAPVNGAGLVRRIYIHSVIRKLSNAGESLSFHHAEEHILTVIIARRLTGCAVVKDYFYAILSVQNI